jgi:hypothetical protein
MRPAKACGDKAAKDSFMSHPHSQGLILPIYCFYVQLFDGQLDVAICDIKRSDPCRRMRRIQLIHQKAPVPHEAGGLFGHTKKKWRRPGCWP